MNIADTISESNDPKATKTVAKPDWLSDEDFALLRACNGSSGDAKWFKRYPKRNHRVRWAEQIEITPDLEASCPEGFFVAIAVMQAAPGCRIRKPFFYQGKLPSGEQASEDWFKWSVSNVPASFWENLDRLSPHISGFTGAQNHAG